jgi:hypothetical protein
MKTTRKSIAQPFATLLLLLLPLTAQCFYNPSAGRWLSRDPIEEQGGANLLAFANNNPGQSPDRLGLCVKECGVKSIMFKPYATWAPLSPGGWILRTTILSPGKFTYNLGYEFEIDIQFLEDASHDPSSCRYVQLIQATAIANGRSITKDINGVPAGDGNLHLDGNWPPPGWTDDNIAKHLNLWKTPTGTKWQDTDTPGMRNVTDGDVVSYNAIFIGLVKDIYRRDDGGDLLTVASTWQQISASGTVPKLSVSPGKLNVF